MVVTTLEKNGIRMDFVVMRIKHGTNFLVPYCKIHTTIGLPFNKKLNNTLHYTRYSQLPLHSKWWRLMQRDFNLMTSKSSAFEFTSERSSVPQPIRVPHFHSNITQKLKKRELKNESSKQDESTFYKLHRNHQRSLITKSILTSSFDYSIRYKNQFTIHSMPITSLLCFLVFFDYLVIFTKLRQKSWSGIKVLRNRYVYMLQRLTKY
jgi:hypothetical protein